MQTDDLSHVSDTVKKSAETERYNWTCATTRAILVLTKKPERNQQMSIEIGQVVKTIYGHIGQVFDSNGTTITLMEIRNDDVYREIGVFHNSKITPHK